VHFMKELTEAVFIARWKSFKSFKKSGGIVLNNENRFTEMEFTGDKVLNIHVVEKQAVKNVVRTNKWNIELKDKKHFLNVMDPKLKFEVITINHTVMVLKDESSGEKIFFVKEKDWYERLKTNNEIII
jgi:hypothetical protein